MYKKFHLSIENEFFNYGIAERIKSSDSYNLLNENVKKGFNNNALNCGLLDAQKIEGEWFPQIEVDIFISHSHKDILLAQQLAYWLKIKFDLNVFIDSSVWGYADDLIEKLKNDNQNFPKLESHVHSILTIALHKMINKAECLFFLNTSNSSVTVSDARVGTYSPWLYTEIALANLTKIRLPVRPPKKRGINETFAEKYRTFFPTDYSEFISIDGKVLEDWASKSIGYGHNLDCLYELVEIT
jgi:hypothetical protein